jgi:hypothetical protein
MQTIELKNFRLIHPRIGLGGVRAELERNELAWQISTARQTRLPAQRETEAIVLRRPVLETPDADVNECHAVADAEVAAYFPRTLAWLRSTADILGGELARAMFTRILPHGQVHRHIDNGTYHIGRRRYHLVVHSAGGSPLGCGDEEVVMREGELWEFDNKKPHDARNPSGTMRVHLIFDLRQP